MRTTRLEAFSDGVLAIIITIMVLELKVPHAVELAALKPVLPVLLSYILSFIYLGIYWNNHHHLFQATEEVSGEILWANLHLLFWLSLFPFTTAWMGENHLAPIPTAIYGFVLLMAAIGKPAPKEVLPEKLQKRESPTDRRKLTESICEGPFRFLTSASVQLCA